MNWKMEKGVLTIAVSGKVDSVNAEAFGAEIDRILAEQPSDAPVLDLADLEYISSAGLRQILRLRKQKAKLLLINVSAEVYEIFNMTGFTEMMDIRKAYRRMSVDGCDIIGEGSNGIIYRYSPDTIIKVYRNPDALDDIHRERELAKTALVAGINTAIPFDIVRVGESYGSVFELLQAAPITERMTGTPEESDPYIRMFAEFLKDFHTKTVPSGKIPSAKLRTLEYCDFLESHDALSPELLTRLRSLLEAVPEEPTLIHGDYHSNNLMYVNGEPIIIDMDTLATGNPIFDLSNLYLAYRGFGAIDPTVIERFFHTTWDTCSHIFELTMDVYFDGRPGISRDEALRRMMVVGLTRLLRRTIRREPGNTALLDFCRSNLAELIPAVDSLAI